MSIIASVLGRCISKAVITQVSISMRSNSYTRTKPREINRVRVYIYTFSGISFILGFLEGIHQATPRTLIIHLSVGLLFLSLAPLSYKRPVLAVLSCGVIQALLWLSFMVTDPNYLQWLGIKIPAIIMSIVALRIALIEKNQRSLVE